MLFWRMHRCARIIFSPIITWHLTRNSVLTSWLIVVAERANAEGEVRRSFTGNYGPLYQLAYMMEGNTYALKKNW